MVADQDAACCLDLIWTPSQVTGAEQFQSNQFCLLSLTVFPHSFQLGLSDFSSSTLAALRAHPRPGTTCLRGPVGKTGAWRIVTVTGLRGCCSDNVSLTRAQSVPSPPLSKPQWRVRFGTVLFPSWWAQLPPNTQPRLPAPALLPRHTEAAAVHPDSLHKYLCTDATLF